MTYTLAKRLCAMTLLAGSAFCGSTASADTIWSKAGAGKGPAREVKILKMDKGALVFTVTASDRQDTRPLDEIAQIKLDNDPGFSAAELAFVSEQWEPAATGYQKVLDASKVDWMRQRSTVRLIEAATKSANFGQMARGYAELVKTDPAGAAKHKPAIPTDKAGSLGGAVAEVDKVLNSTGVTADQKASLTSFKVELLNANGEKEKANALISAVAATPTVGAAPGAPEGAGSLSLKMTAAAAAIGAKDYPKAIQLINDAQESITDPAQQVEAFFLRGDAKAGIAKDANGNREAALDYMRAVARAKATNVKSPRVAEALFKTAQILEKLDVKAEALALYQQTAEEYKDEAPAQQAAASATRLSAALKGGVK